jgi:glycerophosphoryl diester phosphodiesterase
MTHSEHNIACIDCRKAHRKCDKRLPSCGYCAEARKECIYELRRARTTKKKTCLVIKDQTYTFCAQEKELVRVHNVNMHTDICLGNIMGYIPVIPLQRIRELLEYVCAFSTNHEVSIEPEMKDIVLIFSMQRMWFKLLLMLVIVFSFTRQGHKEIAKRLDDKIKMLLGDNWSDQNYEIAASFGYIGMYYTSCADSRARFYLRNCRDYLANSNNPDGALLLQTVTGQLVLFEYGRNLPLIVQMVSKFAMNMVGMEYEDWTTLSPNVIDERANILISLMEHSNDKISIQDYEGKKLSVQLVALGAKLEYVKSIPKEIVTTLEITNAITKLTTSQYYARTPECLTVVVIEAAIVQTSYILQGGDKRIIDLIKQNALALRTIAARSELVSYMHHEFMNELDNFITEFEMIEEMDMQIPRPRFPALTLPICKNN